MGSDHGFSFDQQTAFDLRYFPKALLGRLGL